MPHSTRKENSNRKELGAFLRERRRALPEQAGQRTPGLRREDVAARAFISTEYYTRIEQGRFVPSIEVLEQICEVLGLSNDQRHYVRDLARADRDPTLLSSCNPDEAAMNPGILRLIRSLVDVPVLAIGANTAILAWNDAACELFGDPSQVDAAERTCAHQIFLNEEFQSRFVDVSGMQDVVVAILRAGAPSWASSGLEQLVADLSARSGAFVERWTRHIVQQPHDSTRIALNHPVRGRVDADRVVLRNMDDPEVRLLFFHYR